MSSGHGWPHRRVAAAGVALDLRQGDMRDIVLDEPVALIYCPFRALLHLATWADRRRVFDRVAASLLTEGRFAWDALAFDHRIATRQARMVGFRRRRARLAVGFGVMSV